MQRNQQSTDRTAESTTNQSRETMERLIDLQRNMAEMTLSALEWGESAQRQGIELTQSMLESAPGPQFTESMMERYLEGMEAIVPEMEQAMEQGMRAAAQPETEMENAPPQSSGQRGTAGQRPTGRESEQSAMGGRGRSSQRQMGNQQRPTGSQQPMGSQQQSMGGQRPMGNQQRPMGGQQQTGQRPMGDQRQSGQSAMGGRQPTNQGRPTGGGRSQSQGFQQRSRTGEGYRQTGEWVTPQEYGGESSGTTEYQQRPLSAAPNPSPEYGGQSRRGETSPRRASERGSSASEFEREQQGREQPRETGRRSTAGSRQGPGQPGGSMESRGRSGPGREGHRPTEGGRSGPEQTEQGRLRDQYAQRIDHDRSGGDRIDAGRGEDDRDRSPDRRAMEEADVTSERPETPTDEPPEEG